MVEKCPRHPRFWLGLVERVVITVATSVIKTFNFNCREIELLRDNSELFKNNLQVADCHLENNVKRYIN